MDYMNGMMNPQQFNPATMTQIPYKPVTFEKLSNLIGMTYNLSSIENIFDTCNHFLMVYHNRQKLSVSFSTIDWDS